MSCWDNVHWECWEGISCWCWYQVSTKLVLNFQKPGGEQGDKWYCDKNQLLHLSSSKILRKSEHKVAQKRVWDFCLAESSVAYQLTYEWENEVKETWSGRRPLWFQAYPFMPQGLERKERSLAQLVLSAFSERQIHLKLFIIKWQTRTFSGHLGVTKLGWKKRISTVWGKNKGKWFRLHYSLSSTLP